MPSDDPLDDRRFKILRCNEADGWAEVEAFTQRVAMRTRWVIVTLIGAVLVAGWVFRHH